MKRKASKPWKLDINKHFEPSVSILIPMRNEEKTIQFKLENLYKVNYPAEKVQVIAVNDGSTDKTLSNFSESVNSYSKFDITILNQQKREGKANSLNLALKNATGDIIIVGDADCFWPSDILMKALPYLSDPNVGAVAGRELILNPQETWVTESERFYDSFVHTTRLGESKVHSTIVFQGGFAAYKRAALECFDRETDDSGTALKIVQKGMRTLIIPDGIFYTMFPDNWKNKFVTKIRRANQLQQIWKMCLKLMIRRKLVLPKKIATPEIFLYLFNPVIFLALLIITPFLVIEHSLLVLALLLVLLSSLLVSKSRVIVIEIVQNNLILLVALAELITKRKMKMWATIDESRSLLTREILQQKNLI